MSEPAPLPPGPRALMSGWQVVSLIFGILLLLPGGCFLFFGIGMTADGGEMSGIGPPLLIVGLLIAAVAVLCFWLAFRRRAPPTPGRIP